jgi:hypothetical protein
MPIFSKLISTSFIYHNMSNKHKILELYRSFYVLTRNCPDRSVKLYIRRRAAEDFRAWKDLSASDSER